MEIIELEEEEERKIPKDRFDEAAALALKKRFKDSISVEFPSPLNNAYVIRSNGYIGYIQINEDYSLRILPKVSTPNIFRMLEYAYNLCDFRLLEGVSKVSSIEGLFERLAIILAKRVLERSHKGLYHDYTPKTDTLTYARGQIQLIPTTRAILRGQGQFTCSYEEHTADLPDNQILAWTLYQLRRFQIERNDVRSLIRKAYFELTKVVSLRHITPQECIKRLYHRLNQDYQPMHGLCRFFLKQGGPGIFAGEYDFIPFILYMPELFESFISEWLKVHLPSAYHLQKQYQAALDSTGNFNFIIDLVISDPKTKTVLCVLDTKYKRQSKPSPSDIQQIVAYAVRMNTPNAFLIYPSTRTESFDLQVGNIRVRRLTFDIEQQLDCAGHTFLQELLTQI